MEPYQDAADAPATPEVVGANLAAAGEGYAMPTLRRRVATIARACGAAGHLLDTKHPAIRETLRGIGRKYGTPSRRAAALATAEIKKLRQACGTAGLAGARDRALFLISFGGALGGKPGSAATNPCGGCARKRQHFFSCFGLGFPDRLVANAPIMAPLTPATLIEHAAKNALFLPQMRKSACTRDCRAGDHFSLRSRSLRCPRSAKVR